MSRILYISAVNCDRKHLENSKMELENSWIFVLPTQWEPCQRRRITAIFMSLWWPACLYTDCQLWLCVSVTADPMLLLRCYHNYCW